MRRSFTHGTLLSVALFGVASVTVPAHANLLTNPSFEAVDASASPFFIRSSTNTPGWTQFGDGVDLIHNNYTQGPAVLVDASNGVQFLDMNQAVPGGLGGIQQIVIATTGVNYRLELDSTAWATNSRGGTLGYELFDPTSSAILAQGSFTDPTGGVWVARSLEAVATSSQIGVRIQGLAATQAGIGLDNVRLNAVTVPEATPLSLVGTGGLLLLPLARRRRTRRASA